MVDAPDSKSGGREAVRVRVPPPVLTQSPAKQRRIAGKAGGPALVPGLLYTNYYTNALGKGILHRGGLVPHVGQHVGVEASGVMAMAA